MKAVLKFAGKCLARLLAAVVVLALVAVAGLNVAKFALYSEYYSIKTNICKNPGLGDGFVCQGICAEEESGKIFVSGYMANGKASRIYITDEEDRSYYVKLEKNGEAFTGHVGGIAVHEDTVYLANGSRLYLMSVTDLLNAEEGASLDVGEGIGVNNSASFVFADDEYVYVGEFHDGGAYVKDHPYETPEGLNHAIMSRYSHDDLTAPDRVYSIRDKVQGVCVTPDGKIVFSTSYGPTDSVYYVYYENSAENSGQKLDGAEVYYLTNCAREIEGPAMSEGLDYYKGMVITLTESASNKYIFGKFFFANHIVGLPL